MKIIAKMLGNKRVVEMSDGELNDLQWIAGVGYNDRKSEIGTEINTAVVKDAIESVVEMQKYKKEIKSMLVKFKKLANLLDNRTDMEKP